MMRRLIAYFDVRPKDRIDAQLMALFIGAQLFVLITLFYAK